MPRIDMRKFEDVLCLVRTRVLSSKVYSIEKIVKEHIAEDMQSIISPNFRISRNTLT